MSGRLRNLAVGAALAGLVALAPSCSLCHHWLEGRRTVRKLAWIEMATPQQDLVAAVMKEDYRFIGVYGRAPEVPGVSAEQQGLVTENGVRYIEGTSAIEYGSEAARLNEKARKYADRYNKLLAAFLNKRGLAERISR